VAFCSRKSRCHQNQTGRILNGNRPTIARRPEKLGGGFDLVGIVIEPHHLMRLKRARPSEHNAFSHVTFPLLAASVQLEE
jgi:hypothetical protein